MPLRTHCRSYGDYKPEIGPGVNPSSLVAQYGAFAFLFNEGGGKTAYDLTDNGWSGTLKNQGTDTPADYPQWVPGRFGSSLQFNGSATLGSCVRFNAGATSNISTTCTIMAWVFPTGTPASNYAQIIGNNGGNAGLFYHGTSILDWFQGSDHLSSGTAPLNQWSHIAVTLAAGAGTFYINGKKDSTFTVASPAAVALQSIGCDTANEAYQGNIDHLIVLDKIALTADMVQQFYSDPFHWVQPPRRKRFFGNVSSFVWSPALAPQYDQPQRGQPVPVSYW